MIVIRKKEDDGEMMRMMKKDADVKKRKTEERMTMKEGRKTMQSLFRTFLFCSQSVHVYFNY